VEELQLVSAKRIDYFSEMRMFTDVPLHSNKADDGVNLKQFYQNIIIPYSLLLNG
jgi:hypothetical protein